MSNEKLSAHFTEQQKGVESHENKHDEHNFNRACVKMANYFYKLAPEIKDNDVKFGFIDFCRNKVGINSNFFRKAVLDKLPDVNIQEQQIEGKIRTNKKLIIHFSNFKATLHFLNEIRNKFVKTSGIKELPLNPEIPEIIKLENKLRGRGIIK